MKIFNKYSIKEIILTVIGVFITVFLTPLIATCITWYLFPNIKMTFIQVMWIFFCIWLIVQYITISIEKSLEDK